jgi:sialidase-1
MQFLKIHKICIFIGEFILSFNHSNILKIRPVLLFLVIIVFLTGCQGQQKRNEDFQNSRGISLILKKQPILAGRNRNELLTIDIPAVSPQEKQLSVKRIDIKLEKSADVENLSSISIYYSEGSDSYGESVDPGGKPSDPSAGETAESAGPFLFGSIDKVGAINKIKGNIPAGSKSLKIGISFSPSDNPCLTAKIIVKSIRIFFSGGKSVDLLLSPENRTLRFGLILRGAGQDNCDTYRIPGLITTGSGTLIAVYDNRYNRSKDLQEDIDVGMSRSTDGGESWEPMKVIMDMGEYGGRAERLNGIGDPSILYDHVTNTIWVAALWKSGGSYDEMLWFASGPGMDPDVTGQFVLVKSMDDGLSWSDPVNITGQIKDPAWQLLLQGPGRGITTTDGTLVFPAQFKADLGTPAIDGGKYTSHSSIVYSQDNGSTWQIGKGAKPNTTEAQVIELSGGSLMLNMRDDLNRNDKSGSNGRAVSVTSDLGMTWTKHPSSNSLLPEPNCMASLIAADINIGGTIKKVLFFSNPDNRNTRTNMTIKASLDEGMSWPEEYRLGIYDPEGFGYSCLTMVDEKTLGILYESVKELYFQKIPVEDILKGIF